jgi:ketosteroid isomerase-like protein
VTAVSRVRVADWLARYERAWRTAGTDTLVELFTEDATYQLAPYDDPLVGLPAIAAMWEVEREGPNEVFSMTSDIVAVDGATAVVRVEVVYGDPAVREYRDLWVIRFDADGHSMAFEEWPFWPEQPRTARDPR